MDLILILKAIIMGLVEGATEFLPVSSTGHLILAGHFLGFAAKDNVFEIVIQTGAIIAVILLYFSKLWKTLIGLPTQAAARRFALSVTLAFIPAAVLGIFLHDFIKHVLFSPYVVSVALIVGGVVLIAVEKLHLKVTQNTVDDITLPNALKIGAVQCLAMVPGVSRSGATIVGAMLFGVERKAAAEFSFYLAIPTIVGATVLDLVKAKSELLSSDYMLIAVGFAAAFISAIVVIKAFISWLTSHGMAAFGWYRIIAGVLMLGLLWGGVYKADAAPPATEVAASQDAPIAPVPGSEPAPDTAAQ